MDVVTASLRLFENRYASPQDVRCFFAPGRVNLIGSHTDYNAGAVLPVAIDRGIALSIRRSDDGVWRVSSADFADGLESRSIPTSPGSSSWLAYVVGVLRTIADRGFLVDPVEVAIATDLPIGSGLSSSAALTVGLAGAIAEVADLRLERHEIASIAHEAETRHVGVQCGRMDQLAVALARRDRALYLDLGDQAQRLISLPEKLGLLVIDSAEKHSLASSEYNRRVAECQAAAQKLDPAAMGLARISVETLTRLEKRLTEVERRRARHVISESGRVAEVVRFIEQGELGRVGRLLNESHRSCRDDYEISTPRLDGIQSAVNGAGAYGARVVGAGFGGCVLALIDSATEIPVVDLTQATCEQNLGFVPKIHSLRSSDGFHEVQPSS